MGTRPHIEIVIGIVHDGSKYNVSNVDWERLETTNLGDLEDEPLQLFEPEDAELYLAEKLHIGNPGFKREEEHILGFVYERINAPYLLIDLLTESIDFKETNMGAELYIDLPQMDEEEFERRKKEAYRVHKKWSGMWDLAKKENRLLPYEPYPQITDRWWEQADRALKFAGYDVPREQLKMYLVVYWC